MRSGTLTPLALLTVGAMLACQPDLPTAVPPPQPPQVTGGKLGLPAQPPVVGNQSGGNDCDYSLTGNGRGCDGGLLGTSPSLAADSGLPLSRPRPRSSVRSSSR